MFQKQFSRYKSCSRQWTMSVYFHRSFSDVENNFMWQYAQMFYIHTCDTHHRVVSVFEDDDSRRIIKGGWVCMYTYKDKWGFFSRYHMWKKKGKLFCMLTTTITRNNKHMLLSCCYPDDVRGRPVHTCTNSLILF